MGYSLRIGEGAVGTYEEDGLDDACYIGATEVRRDDAPAFGDPTDYTNDRWPSYSAWFDFCDFVDILPLMYVEDHDGGYNNIRGGHPGAFPINKAFKDGVDEAMVNLRKRFPDIKAEYTGNEEDGALCRLTWLQYWTDWALENCETPILVNS